MQILIQDAIDRRHEDHWIPKLYKELAIRAENPYSKKLGILIVDYDEEREPFGEYLRPRFKNRFKIMVIIYGY